MKPTLKKSLTILMLLFVSLTTKAQTILANFEDIPVGTKWTMWQKEGNSISSTATVEVDPTNPNNHILHIRLKDWGTFPEFNVPSEYAGIAILSKYKSVRFRLYRTASETDDYKQMHVYYGNDQIYADQSYPQQGNRREWQNRSYDLKNIKESNTSTKLRLGLHHASSDYYIDDVALYGPFDDYKEIADGILNICKKNTSSDYSVYTTPTLIPEEKSLTVYTSRYTDFYAPLAGKGTLNIYSGGERTYIGEHVNKKYADWSLFTGDVHVYPYKEVETSAGFYGLVMATNGKTFSPENIKACIEEGKVCSSFDNNRVFLHKGAAIAMENGTRAARYGELNTEADSRLYGYYKNTSGTGAYYLIGNLNTDATLAGLISPTDNTSSQNLGIIKEGKGTYRLTSKNNLMPGGIRVIGGRFNVNGDAKCPVTIFKSSIFGGTGSVYGNIDNYGILEPGDKNDSNISGIGTLKATLLIAHPASTYRVKIKSADEHDALSLSGDVKFSKNCEDFTTSNESPRLRVILAEDYNLSVGDEIEVLTAKTKTEADTWQWNVIFPSHFTWTMEERTLSDGRYAVVLKVTSLVDDPDNAGNDDIKDGDDDDDDKKDDDKTTYHDDGDTHSLREYADEAGVRIGMAVSSYIDINNSNDARTKLIKSNFNMVVPENNLKFESVEPSQNYFSYGEGDKLVNFAKQNNMYMRGHTLAWHNQLAQWVSSDGKKNDKNWTKKQLLDILKNHIMNVVGHYKGKISEWDVVNECLDDDQSIVRTNPDGYKLRQQSVWTIVCGEEFIDSAFVWAHRADPDAKLILNDYDNEFMGQAKALAFYNLAKRLKKDGRPIDGVGFQCHLNAGKVDHNALRNNIARYADLGLSCTITELDLGIDDITEASLQQQARDYKKIIDTAMSQPHCRSVLIWGLTDDMSWRSSSPLIWDNENKAKPAFYAVRAGLHDIGTGINAPVMEESGIDGASLLRTEYYSINGIRITEPSGLCIMRKVYSNGTTTSKTILRK